MAQRLFLGIVVDTPVHYSLLIIPTGAGFCTPTILQQASTSMVKISLTWTNPVTTRKSRDINTKYMYDDSKMSLSVSPRWNISRLDSLWAVGTFHKDFKTTTHKGPSELNPTLDSVYDEHGKVVSCTGHLCWASFHWHGDNEILIFQSLYIYAKSFEKCRERFHHISSSRTGQHQISILESTATKKQLLPPRSNDDMKASKGFRTGKVSFLVILKPQWWNFSLPTNSHS